MINHFSSTLYTGQGLSSDLTFIDALTLLRSDKLGRVLKSLQPNTSDIIRSGFSDISGISNESAAWVITACGAIAELRNDALDKGHSLVDSLQPKLQALKDELPGEAAWGALIDHLSASTSYEQLEAECRRLVRSAAARFQNSARSFIPADLFREASNALNPDLDYLRLRAVPVCTQDISFPGEATIVNINNSTQLFLMASPRCGQDLEGAASLNLFGFTHNVLPRLGTSEFSEQAQKLSSKIGSAEVVLKSKLGTQAKTFSDLSNKDVQVTSDVARELVESMMREYSDAECISAISRNLDGTLNATLNDPRSPYYDKGYTKQSLISMVLNKALRQGAYKNLAADMQQAIDESVANATAAKFILEATEAPGIGALGINFEPAKEVAARVHKEASEAYYTALEAAELIFNLDYEKLPKPPEVNSLRQNDGGGVSATSVLLAILCATAIVAYVIQRVVVKNLRDCKALADTQSDMLKSTQIGIERALKTGGNPDTIISLIDGMSMELNPEIEKLLIKGCPVKLIPGMGALKSLQTKFPRSGTEVEKREFLQTASIFIVQESELLKKEAATIEKRIEDEKKEDPLGSLFNSFSSVIEYAGYAALGLGVIWGALKVYKSFKSEDN